MAIAGFTACKETNCDKVGNNGRKEFTSLFTSLNNLSSFY